MRRSSPIMIRLAALAICGVLASGIAAQPTTDTTPTTAMSAPEGTMSKGQIKDQRKQQKKDEAAAKANAKAAKAAANSKTANDKALQAEEKAGQVTQNPTPAAAAPTTQSTTTTTAAPPQ